jgi:hypothetical protein
MVVRKANDAAIVCERKEGEQHINSGITGVGVVFTLQGGFRFYKNNLQNSFLN